MHLTDLRHSLDLDQLADELIGLIRALAPLPRSLTGEANRETLRLLNAVAPISVVEVPTGTDVLDWSIPDEWNVHEAWIADSSGCRIVDWAAHPLHLVGYSRPIRTTIDRSELDAHLHSLPDRPDAIPYRTAYYADDWGFCLADSHRAQLGDGPFDVCVDATIAPGSMTYGEAVIPGATDEMVLITTHLCHPAMANDNATGLAAVALLNRVLRQADLRREHRVLVLPGTLGAISWLAAHHDVTDRIAGGLVVTGLGDGAPLTYKRSRAGDRLIDRAASAVLAHHDASLVDFSPYGYDERQFCSPGFDLGVGRLSRRVHGEYPEYHTSNDNLEFVTGASVADAVAVVLEILDLIDRNERVVSRRQFGEPQLGRRGLYSSTGGAIDSRSIETAYLWVLNLADGNHDLIDMATRSGLSPDAIVEAVRRLVAAELLDPTDA